MDLGLAGARVIVTAGASGIGLEIARAFAAEGARVEVCDVSSGALAALRDGGSRITGTVCDVSDREACGTFMQQAIGRLGGLDVLVNNAGIAGPTGPIHLIDPKEWDRTVTVNLTGTYNITRLAIDALKKSKNPSIICLSSGAGRLGFPLRTPYAAAKWAIVGLAKSLAMELGEDGIRVNALLPGSTDGPRIRGVFADKARERNTSPDEIEAMVLAGTSMKRLIPPQHLAATAVFLASTAATTLSGQAISVDGDLQTLV